MAQIERMLVWAIDETAGFDSSWATINEARLVADGRAVGLRPTPYWTTYRLETGEGFVTDRLRIESRWVGGGATLDLQRHGGVWTANGEPRPDLETALIATWRHVHSRIPCRSFAMTSSGCPAITSS